MINTKEINELFASLGITPLSPDDVAEGDPMREWLEAKPRTTRYMNDEQRAALEQEIKKTVAEFRAWLERNRKPCAPRREYRDGSV